jgi:hypothetical protein
LVLMPVLGQDFSFRAAGCEFKPFTRKVFIMPVLTHLQQLTCSQLAILL